MDSKQVKGSVSEFVIMLEYVEKGYTINIPTTPARYDFIAEKDGRMVKVQVKHGTPFNNNTEILGFSKTPYSRADIDIIAFYDSESNQVYFVPASHVEGMTSIRLRLEPYKNNVKSEKALFAEHYTKFIG